MKHGHCGGNNNSPTYIAWISMNNRCERPMARGYKYYGGRGITVCERWHVFQNFLTDMGERPSSAHSLDRYPNNRGNYEPGNVRWATRFEQARNRTTNHFVAAFGVTRTLTDWSVHTGLGRDMIRLRLAKGWDAERALTVPSRIKNGRQI